MALGIGTKSPADRELRIITPDDAAARPSPDGADTGGCDMVPLPWEPQQQPGTQSRWRWGRSSPGGTWLGPESRCSVDAKTGAYSPECLRNVTLAAPYHSTYAAAASRQEAPYRRGMVARTSALLPPTRSVEPWTTEEWLFVFQQGSSALNFGGGAGLIGGYSRYPNLNAPSMKFPWTPMPKRSKPNYWPYGLGHDMPFGAFDTIVYRSASMRFPMRICPRITASKACTTMDEPIAPNDTCRQAIVWHKPPQDVPAAKCSRLFSGPGLANKTRFGKDREAYVTEVPPTRAYHVPYPPGSRQFPFEAAEATGVYNRWHQVLTVVYPPGTVAQLSLESRPDDPGLRLRSTQPSYPWTVNRGFVVQTIMNVAPLAAILRLPGQDPFMYTDGGSVMCDLDGNPFQNPHPEMLKQRSAMVVVDDPSCVRAKTCSPEVPANATVGSPEHLHAVRQWLKGEYFNVSMGMRVPRFACALTHFLDEQYVMDVVHYDYPAARSSLAATIGYAAMAGDISTDGGWGNKTRSAMDEAPRSTETLESPAPTPWPIGGQPSVLQGPVARYRGAALQRIVAPPASLSLPPIDGGSWTCMDTSPIGAFFMRPVCRAECNDPTHLAVDVGLDQQDESSGWLGVVSLARPWLSRWGGYPALLQSRALIPRADEQAAGVVGSFHFWDNMTGWQPPEYETVLGQARPRMACRADEGKRMHWDARWMQRHPVSRAVVRFTLAFDRSTWPAAYFSLTGSLGLAYPTPTEQQLRRLRAEVQADVGDLLGEVDWTQRGRGVEAGIGERRSVNRTGVMMGVRVLYVLVLDVRALDPVPGGWISGGGPSGLRSNSSAMPAYLPVEVDVSVSIPELPEVQFGVGAGCGCSLVQRGRSAGTLAHELASILRGYRPGSEGGVWLPSVAAGSVQYDVYLPCLRGGYGRGLADCSAVGYDYARSWTGVMQACTAVIIAASLVGLCMYSSFRKVDSGPTTADGLDGHGRGLLLPSADNPTTTSWNEQYYSADLGYREPTPCMCPSSNKLAAVCMLGRWLQYVVLAVALLESRIGIPGVALCCGLVVIMGSREVARCCCGLTDPLSEWDPDGGASRSTTAPRSVSGSTRIGPSGSRGARHGAPAGQGEPMSARSELARQQHGADFDYDGPEAATGPITAPLSSSRMRPWGSVDPSLPSVNESGAASLQRSAAIPASTRDGLHPVDRLEDMSSGDEQDDENEVLAASHLYGKEGPAGFMDDSSEANRSSSSRVSGVIGAGYRGGAALTPYQWHDSWLAEHSRLRRYMAVHVGEAITARLLSVLQWDALRLLWARASGATSNAERARPIASHERSGSIHFSVLDKQVAWHASCWRSAEDLLVLVVLLWALLCASGSGPCHGNGLGWHACELGAGSGEGGFQVLGADRRLYWAERVARLCVPVLVSVVCMIGSVALSLGVWLPWPSEPHA